MKKKLIILILVCLVITCSISIYLIPKLRITLFVHSYHKLIEEGIAAGHGVPADDTVFLGYDLVNTWHGDYSMTEFVIMTYGNTYYGCYYSPDNVPLAFQNTDVELIQNGHEYWEWKGDGDNRGSTSRIMDYWYFFKASF